MQPGYAPPPTYNNFSQQLLTRRDEWARELGIKDNEMLVFRTLGTGKTQPLKYKSTEKSAEYTDFEQMKPTPKSFCIPNQESIPDRGTAGGFVQMAYFEGGYAPGKVKAPVMFVGEDETAIKVVPVENPALYDFLTMSPRLKGGVSSNPRIAPQYEVIRPDHEVEGNWEDDQRQATVILAIGDASYETLKFLAPKVGLPADTSTEQRMRKNFGDYAKRGAEQVAKLDHLFLADETKVYQQVEKAIAADVVRKDTDKHVWVLSSTGDSICPASPDRNTIDQLVGFLILEAGQPTYKQILALSDGKRGPGRPKAN